MRETEVAQIMALADAYSCYAADDGFRNCDDASSETSAARARLETRIREALSEQWVPVSERLPDVLEQVQFWCATNGGYYCVGFKGSSDPDDLRWNDTLSPEPDGVWSARYEVTHWMPLPAAPSGAAKEPT